MRNLASKRQDGAGGGLKRGIGAVAAGLALPFALAAPAGVQVEVAVDLPRWRTR